jgi:hypothetical protein
VMHAAKGVAPGEQDFRFLREFLDFADVGHWFQAVPSIQAEGAP